MMDYSNYQILIGTGGIGSGIFFQLQGNHTLGREESRLGYLLEARDFCKLHIICHYVAVILGPGAEGGSPFRTVPLGRVGADETGRRLVSMMQGVGMDTGYVTAGEDAATLFSVCFQYPDSSGGNITTADSAGSRVAAEDIRRAESLFEEYAGRGIALAAPEVPLEARLELLKTACRHGFLRVCALNTAEISQPGAGEFLRNADILSINRDEAEALVQDSFNAGDPMAFLRLVDKKCAPANPGLKICLTLGSSGSWGFENGAWEFTPCAQVEPRSTAGAGDATIAGLIVSAVWGLPFILPRRQPRKQLAEAPLETAMDFAALLASLSVESVDTIHLGVNRRTLREHAKKLGIGLSGSIGLEDCSPA